jgi:hypothetical protein
MPVSLDQIVIPPGYQVYSRTENHQEQFLLADSEMYEDNGAQR